MKRLETRRLGMIVVLWAASAYAYAAPSILQEVDRNQDGKTDGWYWKIDDQVTSALIDAYYDGIPDLRLVYGQRDGEYQIVEKWTDNDRDGQFDWLMLYHDDGVSETWAKDEKGRTDEKGRIIINYHKSDSKTDSYGRAAALGSRAIEDLKTYTRPPGKLVEKTLDGKITASFRGGKPVDVRARLDDETAVTMVSFDETTFFPRTIVLHPNCRENGLRGQTYSDKNGDGLAEKVGWSWDSQTVRRDLSTVSTYRSVRAFDRNEDGKFDEFRTISREGENLSYRMEKDRDYDGVLDYVEFRSGDDGDTQTLVGEQIPDRTPPRVPVMPEEVWSIWARIVVEARAMRE